MKEFFSTLLYSWGSDTPQEVYWALVDLVKFAKTRGFTSTVSGFDDPIQYSDEQDADKAHSDNEQLIDELTVFFETKL